MITSFFRSTSFFAIINFFIFVNLIISFLSTSALIQVILNMTKFFYIGKPIINTDNIIIIKPIKNKI